MYRVDFESYEELDNASMEEIQKKILDAIGSRDKFFENPGKIEFYVAGKKICERDPREGWTLHITEQKEKFWENN